MSRRVDQKLHFAKLVLAAIEANPGAEAALAEAALFQLSIAYRAYLREILESFKLVSTPDNAQQAAEQLHAEQLFSADIDELVKLERSGAWPAQLRTAYAAAASIEIVSVPAQSAAIVLRDVTEQIDGGICTEWLRQFNALLQRQREHAQEW